MRDRECERKKLCPISKKTIRLSRVKMNGCAALDNRSDSRYNAIKRSVIRPLENTNFRSVLHSAFGVYTKFGIQPR